MGGRRKTGLLSHFSPQRMNRQALLDPFHPMAFNFPWFALLLATLLSVHGLRKRSLSPSGAVTAFVVGFGMMSVKLHVFGVGLIAFYLAGSRATKLGKIEKSKLEDTSEAAGYRTAFQVGTRL